MFNIIGELINSELLEPLELTVAEASTILDIDPDYFSAVCSGEEEATVEFLDTVQSFLNTEEGTETFKDRAALLVKDLY